MTGLRLPAIMAFDAFEAALVDRPEDKTRALAAGRVYVSSAGRTAAHNVIVQNIGCHILTQARAAGSPFRTFLQTLYLKSCAIESALLPDVMVRSGRLPPGASSCDDPVAIVEVLDQTGLNSGSDRWEVCRRIPTLQHYVLVARETALVAVYDRAGDAWYERRTIEGLDATLDLPAIGVSISLAEIYRDVLSA